MTIEEGNRLIAIFVGDEIAIPRTTFAGNKITMYAKPSEVGDWSVVKMYYHSSWDKLMPVVEKINNVFSKKQNAVMRGDGDDGEDKDLDDPTGWRSWSMRDVHLSTDIINVWKKSVEAIQWYNNNTK